MTVSLTPSKLNRSIGEQDLSHTERLSDAG
jgi:hypothetical protein